jgi:hypothetical protein
MTKREREQVVELLRCAADRNDPLDAICGFAITGARMDAKRQTLDDACCALVQTVGESGDDWQRDCLEAAARVEEGSWP